MNNRKVIIATQECGECLPGDFGAPTSVTMDGAPIGDAEPIAPIGRGRKAVWAAWDAQGREIKPAADWFASQDAAVKAIAAAADLGDTPIALACVGRIGR